MTHSRRSATALSRAAGILAACLAGTSSLPAQAADLSPAPAPAPVESREWQVIVSPYLWAASLTGSARVYGIERDVNVPFNQVLESLDFGLMGAVEVTNGLVGVFVNGEYVTIGGSAGKLGNINYGSTTTILAAGAYFKLFSVDLGGNTVAGTARTLSINPLAGARWTKLSADVGIGPFVVGGSEDWVDPFVGAQLAIDITDRWNLTVEGDVGGFGVGSDLALNGQAYLGYRTQVFGYNTMLRAGYRALYQDYENGGFKWDVTQHGPVLGASIAF